MLSQHLLVCPMKIISIQIIFLLFLLNCKSQIKEKDSDSILFNKYIKTILEDSTNQWKEYPKPPPLTDDVLIGLKKELKNDSTRYYFEQLSPANFKSHQNYENALSFFEKHQNSYSILALTAHWNPDARISALKSLNFLIKLRPLICATKEGFKQLKRDDQVEIKFLLYLLQSNPLFINGSENATIHSVYLSNILCNLDLLTNENIVAGKNFNNWYKNDLQFESAVLQWKKHLKKEE